MGFPVACFPKANTANRTAGYAAIPAAYFAAVVTAGGSLTDDQKNAVNTAYNSFVANGTTPRRWWPTAGGTANSHKVELMTQASGVYGADTSHDANGVTGIVSAASRFESGYIDSSDGVADSISIYCYNRTQTPTDGGAFFGAYVSPSSDRLGMSRSGGFVSSIVHSTNTALATVSGSDFRGKLWSVRESNTVHYSYFNNVQSALESNAASGRPTNQLYFLLRHWGAGAGDVDLGLAANIASFGIFDGLTQAQIASVNTIIDTYETAMGRNV